MNKSDTDLNNFKIQIYNGSRSGAISAQKEYKSTFNQWESSLEYEEPNFKIWVGSFTTKLEADRALKRIKNKFSGAFIFKPKKCLTTNL